MASENVSLRIKHYKYPTTFRGVFWMPSKKIYINCLVKNYPILYKHVLEHEKKHYRIYNSGKPCVIRIFLDMINECNAWLKFKIRNDLLTEEKSYQIIVSNKNDIIKNLYKLMKKLNEKTPTRNMEIYAKIVRDLWPLPLLSPFLLVIIQWWAEKMIHHPNSQLSTCALEN